MNTKTFSNALGEIGDQYVSEAISYSVAKKKNGWVKWGAVAACLCLVFSLFAIEAIINPQVTQVPLPGGFLAEVIEVIDNDSCKIVVTGEDNNFDECDILTINYNGIRANSGETDRTLRLGDIIAVTYESYEEKSGEYSITIEYVDLIKPTE